MLSIDLRLRLRLRLRTAAEEEAVRAFASNRRDLLLAAPDGARLTLGLDPGYRSGVKVAVVDATGKVVATSTIYGRHREGEGPGGRQAAQVHQPDPAGR